MFLMTSFDTIFYPTNHKSQFESEVPSTSEAAPTLFQQGFSQPSLSLSLSIAGEQEGGIYLYFCYTPLAQLIILTQYIMTLGNWNDQTRKSWERVEQEAFSRTGHGIVDIEP